MNRAYDLLIPWLTRFTHDSVSNSEMKLQVFKQDFQCGSFLEWGYHNLWMVYVMEKNHTKMDDNEGWPNILNRKKPPFVYFPTGHCFLAFEIWMPRSSPRVKTVRGRGKRAWVELKLRLTPMGSIESPFHAHILLELSLDCISILANLAKGLEMARAVWVMQIVM